MGLDANRMLLFLSRVSYNEERREIIAEFENSGEKRIERFKFFPKALLPAAEGIEERIAKEIISMYNLKKFRISRKNEKILAIEASTFKDLKKISNLLQQSLKKSLQLIEPERQFLLEKEWNYFQAFKNGKFGMEMQEILLFPEAMIEGCSESIRATARQLLKHDKKAAESFLKNIALSKFLKIPSQYAPESIKEASEKFLENSLFKNSFIIEKLRAKNPSALEKSAHGFFENVAEIDFTPVWASLLSNGDFNIGFETINCNCCRPESINAANVLPSSKAEVSFLQNGLYFESSILDFALEFHNSHENKQARIKRMNEWFLKTIPTGPFNNGEKSEVPLADAFALQNSGKAIISKNSKIEWFCTKRQSFISKEIKALILEITQFEDKLIAWEQSALSTHKVLCASQLSETPEYLLDYYSKKMLEEILRQVLKELNSSNSKFYQQSLASSLNALQSAKIAEFKQLAKANGEKILQSSSHEMLVKAERPSYLIKEFARKSKTSIPTIRKNFKELVID
ncbi:MAG: hypothetical protein Q7R70_00630 [Candidatus Diapherotrites archaeon]|nr:hypothetical protein [Candidatus Diapherotrites archaeon]